MTRLKIEIAADDDVHALRILDTLRRMMLKSLDERFRHTLNVFGTASFDNSLAPGYGTSDMSGSSECTVTREPDPK